MDEVWTGGCQCGAIRYEVRAADILTVYCCHCRECQRQSSSAFGLSVILPQSSFHLQQGTLGRWQRRSDGGAVNRARFCPSCGVRIYHDGGDESAEISLKGGSLDAAERLSPVGHIWISRAVPWVTIPPGLLTYPEQPESLDALIAAYRGRQALGP